MWKTVFPAIFSTPDGFFCRIFLFLNRKTTRKNAGKRMEKFPVFLVVTGKRENFPCRRSGQKFLLSTVEKIRENHLWKL